jgi:hypothetical protein
MKTIMALVVSFSLFPSAKALLVVGDSGTGSVYTNGAGAGSGWNYEGNLTGTAPSSVTYVSNGWFVTANHVWNNDVVGKSQGSLSLDGTTYTIDTDSYTSITNADGTGADLCMFRVNDLTGLPSGVSVLESTPRWSDSLILIGNGYDNGGSTGLTWGDGDLYSTGSGQNRATYTATQALNGLNTTYYLSVYDNAVTGSAYAQTFDSGGGVFVNGQLAGIMVANGTGIGDGITCITDFSIYGKQINQTSVIPEPTTAILLAGVALIFGVIKRIRYMYQ